MEYKTLWKNGSLWSNIVFEKEVTSHSNNKILQARSLLLGIWKHITLCNKCVFLLQLRWPIESKFSQIGYLICRDTPIENSGLWQLPKCPVPLRSLRQNTIMLQMDRTLHEGAFFSHKMLYFSWIYGTTNTIEGFVYSRQCGLPRRYKLPGVGRIQPSHSEG